MCDPPIYVIAPIDRCYELTGTIKAAWEGISGGPGVEAAVDGFFDEPARQGGRVMEMPPAPTPLASRPPPALPDAPPRRSTSRPRWSSRSSARAR